MPAFVSGIDLSREFFRDVVRPLLGEAIPDVPYSAALIGRGSEVLGFDDEMSRDHNWEPRVELFLRPDDLDRWGDDVEAILKRRLPAHYREQATDYSIVTLDGYFRTHLGVDIDRPLDARDWLTLPEQSLLMVTAGAVYHDDIGLRSVRDRFAYYPRDVWLYLLIAAWWRVHPEANLVGRAGFTGDELGSAVIGSRLVHDLMHLCFLMEKRYAPYSKWFGTAFSRLSCAPSLTPLLWRVMQAPTWREREAALMSAYEVVAAMHNAMHITEPVRIGVDQLWDRPFTVVWGDFPGALSAQIQDPVVKRIAERWPTGGVDQLRDVMPAARSRQLLLRVTE